MANTRVNEIDLLRFLAALAVVFFHYTFRGYAADAMSVMPYPLLAPVAKYGYLGVELFFIISGFVILMTAANGSLRSFVVSRFVRLYPAFWACCTITFVMILAIGGTRFSADLTQYLVNMTMLNGFVGVPSIDGAYWSLFVEMRFYALVAALLIIGRIHQAQLFLILWLLASLALTAYPLHMLLHYLLIIDYSAYFIAGATFYLIWSEGITPARVAIIVTSWSLGMFQSISGLQNMISQYHTNMDSYVVAGIVSSFFLVMLMVSLRRTGSFGNYRWVLAGSLTYPLYLIHQNVGFMIFNLSYPRVNAHFILWSTIALVLGSAYAVHVLVEKPSSLLLKNATNDFFDYLQRLILRSARREDLVVELEQAQE